MNDLTALLMIQMRYGVALDFLQKYGMIDTNGYLELVRRIRTKKGTQNS